jgi:hypothetical protein
MKARTKHIPDIGAFQQVVKRDLFISISDQQNDHFESMMMRGTFDLSLNGAYVTAFAVFLCQNKDGKLDGHQLESHSSACNVISYDGIPSYRSSSFHCVRPDSGFCSR